MTSNIKSRLYDCCERQGYESLQKCVKALFNFEEQRHGFVPGAPRRLLTVDVLADPCLLFLFMPDARLLIDLRSVRRLL